MFTNEMKPPVLATWHFLLSLLNVFSMHMRKYLNTGMYINKILPEYVYARKRQGAAKNAVIKPNLDVDPQVRIIS